MTEEELYSVPPDSFVAERNALAKRLRDDGDKAAADRVKKLAKPSVPAWAVNRAASEAPKAARALLDSGERLAAAQSGAAGEGGGEQLREAMSAHQRAVEGLMGDVEKALASEGHESPAMADRARETLRALATDDELREEFEAGRVGRDREPVGFGSAPAPKAAPRKKADPKREREEAAAHKRAERAEAAAAKAVKRARAKAGKAEAALEAAREELREVEAEHERASAELEAAP
jgi:hypothetical protein